MTTPTLDRDAVVDLYEKKIPEKYTPKMYAEPRPIRATPELGYSHPEELTNPASELAVKYISELRETDPDERLDYIRVANPAVTEEHLGQLALTTDRWLDNEARERIRAIARKHAEDQSDPRQVLLEWLTDEELARFHSALDETTFPDSIIGTCYALCMAEGVGHAAYFIHQDRTFPQVEVTKFEQTPEEIEDDLRFVNAK